MNNLFTEQLDLEKQMQDRGLHRYRQNQLTNIRKGRLAVTDGGSYLVKRAVEAVATAIGEFIQNASTGKAGRKHSALKYLQLGACRTLVD